MFKSFKYRIYPNKEQVTILNGYIGSCRFVWNHFLDLNIKQYEENKTFIFYNEMATSLPTLKKDDNYNWLSTVPSQILQQKLQDLQTALKSSFSKTKAKKGFPHFKAKKLDQSGVRFPQGWNIVGDKLRLPKMKTGVKIALHRDMEGKQGQLTLKKTRTGKWYVNILCETHLVATKKEINTVLGVDLGIKDFLITSDGRKFNNQNFYKSVEKKTKRLHQNLSRKIKGSNNRNKARVLLAVHSEKVSNRRNDFLNKTANSIAKSCDLVCLEDLSAKNMMQNRRLSKAIQDVSWSMFTIKLQQQCEKMGTNIIKINRFYPSSKRCNACGHKKETLGLDERTYECYDCSYTNCRDINASFNIRDEGLRLYNTAGTAEIYACTDIMMDIVSSGQEAILASAKR